jgi:hypothetical protein
VIEGLVVNALPADGIPDLELSQFRKRVGGVLATYPLLPFFALQYRICEVSKSRPDPRALRAALDEIVDNRTPRSKRIEAGISEVLLDGYSDELSFEDNPAQHTARLTKILKELLVDGSQPAIECLTSLITPNRNSIEGPPALEKVFSRRVLGELIFSGAAVIVEGSANRTRVAVLITHDLDWLYPDNVLLWQLMRHASENERVPVVLARKIAPATFSVLKRIGAVGIQYYSMLVRPIRQQAAVASRGVGWVHTRPAEIEELIPARDRLREMLVRVSEPTESAQKAVGIALALHLDRASDLHSDSLLEWASAVDLLAPPIWFATVRRWKRVRQESQPETHSAIDRRVM